VRGIAILGGWKKLDSQWIRMFRIVPRHFPRSQIRESPIEVRQRGIELPLRASLCQARANLVNNRGTRAKILGWALSAFSDP
jgi:hypothetical protein